MPTRSDPWPAGTPCWVDLATTDVVASTAFYGAVLGWSFFDSGAEFGHYNICQVDGHAAAAIGPKQDPRQPTAWTVYLASDDTDAAAAAITANGGVVLAEPFAVPGNGRMTVATDPAGAAFGVWQAGGTIGAEIYNEPGGLTWEDARLTDPESARAFYTAVFGYHYQPVPGAPDDYRTFHLGEGPLGGIGPHDGPSGRTAVPLGGLLFRGGHRRRGCGRDRPRWRVAGRSDGRSVRADRIPHRSGGRRFRPRRSVTGHVATRGTAGAAERPDSRESPERRHSPVTASRLPAPWAAPQACRQPLSNTLRRLMNHRQQPPASLTYEGRPLVRPDEEIVDQGLGFDVDTLMGRRRMLRTLGPAPPRSDWPPAGPMRSAGTRVRRRHPPPRQQPLPRRVARRRPVRRSPRPRRSAKSLMRRPAPTPVTARTDRTPSSRAGSSVAICGRASANRAVPRRGFRCPSS